jgi:ubiquinol-cytochrome c reductase subunit 7
MMYDRPWAESMLVLTPQQDVPYLTEIVTDIESEMAEREDLEAMVITKRQKNANAKISGGH